MQRGTARGQRAVVLLAWAVLITAVHVNVLVLGATPPGTWWERYHDFFGHDSNWFRHIIEHGYRTILPPSLGKNMDLSNVAFFPAYPLLAKALTNTLGVLTPTGLMLTCHLATCGFWFYVLLLARRWQFGLAGTLAVVALIVSHPAALFTVTAYSESLFLMMLLGYVFWSHRTGPVAIALTAIHGFMMTATRIAGVPAAAWPVVHASAQYWRRGWPASEGSRFVPLIKACFRPLVVAAIAASGAASFFLYCHFRFGHWDLYMWTQERGWGVFPNYLALLHPSTYARLWPDWDVPWQVGQLSVPLTMLTFCSMLWWELRAKRQQRTKWRERAGLYFTGFVLFFIAVSGVWSVNLESMIRYQFCTHVFLMLAGVHAWRDIQVRWPKLRRTTAALAIGAVILGAILQFRYAEIFALGGWVA